MQLDISDEQINGIVKQSINQEVKRRIENSVNDGIAYWFSHQSIQSLTREILIRDYIPKAVEDFMKNVEFDPNEVAKAIGQCVADYFVRAFGCESYES